MHILHDLDELAVPLAPVETRDRYAVAEMRSKREHIIVDDECAAEIDTVEDAEVLVDGLLAPVCDGLSVLSEKSVLDEGARGIDLVDNGIGVPVVACREYSNLVVSVGGPQDLLEVGTDIDALRERPVVAGCRLHLHPQLGLGVVSVR